MQENNEDDKKQVILRKELGKIFKQLRINGNFGSLNKFALGYSINRANLSKIENGEVGCSITTAWRIAEALNLKLSDVIKMLEDKLGEDFTFIEL